LLPPGWSQAAARGINDAGVVIGNGADATGIGKGFIYNRGRYTELLPPGWVYGDALRINDAGIVMGSGFEEDGTWGKGFIATPCKIIK